MNQSIFIICFVLLMACSAPSEKKTPSVFPSGKVPFERIVRANTDSANWLTYSGNYHSHRYSALDQINTTNVAKLKPAWVYQMFPGLSETTPLVVDGIMYLTEPPSIVTALDIKSGNRLWRWFPEMPADVKAIGFPIRSFFGDWSFTNTVGIDDYRSGDHEP